MYPLAIKHMWNTICLRVFTAALYVIAKVGENILNVHQQVPGKINHYIAIKWDITQSFLKRESLICTKMDYIPHKYYF